MFKTKSLGLLALSYSKTGQLEKAQECFEKAFDGWKEILGDAADSSCEVGELFNNLGLCLRNNGHFDQANTYLVAAQKISQKSADVAHRELFVTSTVNLGIPFAFFH